MAIVYVPYTNPIRLHRTDIEVDYSDVLPQDDVMYLRQDYQRGQYAVEDLYPSFDIFNTMTLQYYYAYTSSKDVIVRNMVTNVTYPASTLEVSGIGIQGGVVLNALYRFREEGYFRFEIELDGESYNLVSDIFVVKNWSESKDLIKFTFYDSRNRYGGYHYKSTGLIFWAPIAFYTGFIKTGQPEDDQSVYEGDNGNDIILESDPKRIKNLTLTDIPSYYIDVIKQQTICDNFLVNGDRYAASDFNVEETANSDVVDITMKLTLKDNDYNSILQ